MKTLRTLFVIAIAVVGFTTSSFGQKNTDATASTTIIQPLKIEKVTDLQFGDVASGSTSGTVSMDKDGVRTAGGGVTIYTSRTGTVTPGSFTVSGEPEATYSITLADETIELTTGVTVDLTKDPSSGTLSSGGTETIYVVGTLNVAASKASGTYSGTFNVAVDYN